jgi:GGDEF domain-containing protein
MTGDMRWKSVHFMIDNEIQSENATMIVNDIDERKIAELKKERRNRKDKNTGVYSLDDFYESVQEFIEREGKVGDHIMIMLSITDFDEIRENNMQYSLELECSFVQCIRRAIRKDDIIGKYNDGRFLLFLKGISVQYIQNFISKTRSVFSGQKYMDTDLSDFCMGISVLKDKNKSVRRMSMETLGALELAEQRGRSEIIITE